MGLEGLSLEAIGYYMGLGPAIVEKLLLQCLDWQTINGAQQLQCTELKNCGV